MGLGPWAIGQLGNWAFGREAHRVEDKHDPQEAVEAPPLRGGSGRKGLDALDA